MNIYEKLLHQAKVNPGRKEKYNQPLRPRSAVFNTKKEYNRSKHKKELKQYEE